jgi:hypothetical protein
MICSMGEGKKKQSQLGSRVYDMRTDLPHHHVSWCVVPGLVVEWLT